MKQVMIMTVLFFGLSVGLFPAGYARAEESHDHEHGMGGMHSTMEHGEMAGEHASMKMEKAPAKAVYTCPMHPDVRETKPGKCPQCGMFLEETEAGLATGAEG